MASILVVDDDRNIRRMIVATLEPEGFAVIEAESAERALELLGQSVEHEGPGYRGTAAAQPATSARA